MKNPSAVALGKRNKGVKKTLSLDRLIQLRVQAGVMRKAKLALVESAKS